MDEPTLGDALRARPPADPTYHPSLDPDRPGERRSSRAPAPRPGGTRWVVRLATLGLVAVLAAGAVVIAGSMPSRPSDVADPSPFQPAPMRNGRIAYDRDGDIWLAEADGSGAHAITSGPDNDRMPRWSPDQKWIAFMRGDGADVELHAIHPDGSGDLIVASGMLDVGAHGWVPSNYHTLGWVLLQVDPSVTVVPVVLRRFVGGGGAPEPVVMPGTDPAWSPDGDSLAYLTSATDGQLVFFDERFRSTEHRWPTDIASATSAPDGVMYRPSRLAVADPPIWSPDGARIAMAAGVPGDRDIVIDVDGGAGPRWSTPWDEWSPAWSPDGTELAWLRDEALRTVIQRAAADGTSQWSPIQVDDNATAIVGAPDGSGWLVVRPGGIDFVPRPASADAPRFSIDAPLSSGIVSWEAIPAE